MKEKLNDIARWLLAELNSCKKAEIKLFIESHRYHLINIVGEQNYVEYLLTTERNTYASLPNQPIDELRAKLSAEQFEGYCLGQVYDKLRRYCAPSGEKAGNITDVYKAIHFIDYYLEA